MDLYFNYIHNIKATYEKVQEALLLLAHHIQVDLKNLPIWAENVDGTDFEENRVRVIEAIKRQEIDSKLSPSETFSFAGAVAATDTTINLIRKVNNGKDLFRLAVTQYRQSPFFKASVPASKILEKVGYPGIKVRQVARQLKFINYHPRRIAWSEAKGYSNIVITQDEAIKRLMEAGQGEHITYQLDMIKRLNPSEKLVIQRKIKPYPAANITTFKIEGRCSYEKIESSLPIFFKFDSSKKKTIVEFSSRQIHPQRIDKKIEDEPFLTSISAYRYKTQEGDT